MSVLRMPAGVAGRNAHACSVGLAGDRARAARLLRQVLQDRVRRLGDDHPWITRTREELARSSDGEGPGCARRRSPRPPPPGARWVSRG
ncbi:hypothetical protein [Streptomyces sp. NPDC001070]